MTAGTGGALVGAGSRPFASPDRLLAFVEKALTDATPDRLLLVQVPLARPAGSAARLLEALPSPAFVWRDRADRLSVAVGEAAVVEGRGEDRFRDVRDGATALLDNADIRTYTDADPVAPRLFGGFAFQPGETGDGPWTGFGDARFLLPSLACEAIDGGLLLTLAAPAGLSTADAAGAVHGLRRVLQRLRQSEAGLPDTAAPLAGAVGSVRDPDDGERYRALVAEAVAAIRSGAFEKVVLARRASLAGPLPAAATLLRALAAARGTFRFAHAIGGRIFLGATPERLVSLRGRTVRTEAVAGTTTGASDASLLNGGGKDRWEHELVVRAIAEALAPLARLRRDAAPAVRSAGPLRHLATRFEATLTREAHVLDLVRRLHPTPAVGGAPVTEALAWIADHEPEPRGWYAGPIGWFDAAGDGEFAVALRCGVLSDEGLDLFAGSGIVAGSDPVAEYEETRLKLRALPGALGLR